MDILYCCVFAAAVCLLSRCLKMGLSVTIKLKLNSVTLIRKRTIPTERPPLVGEVSAKFCG
jgi:hypothetical protein